MWNPFFSNPFNWLHICFMNSKKWTQISANSAKSHSNAKKETHKKFDFYNFEMIKLWSIGNILKGFVVVICVTYKRNHNFLNNY